MLTTSGAPDVENNCALPLTSGGTCACIAQDYAGPLAEATHTASVAFSLTARASATEHCAGSECSEARVEGCCQMHDLER